MVKARWNLYFDCRRCFWDWHDDTNAAHFHSKRLHIWFHFVVALINIPVIHMTCRWFTGTISAGTVIPNACFRIWKTNGRHQPQLKWTTEKLLLRRLKGPVYFLTIIWLKHQSQRRVRAHFHRKAFRPASSCVPGVSGFCEGVEPQYFWSGDSLIIGSVCWIWSNLSDQSGYGEFAALANVLSKSAEPT